MPYLYGPLRDSAAGLDWPRRPCTSWCSPADDPAETDDAPYVDVIDPAAAGHDVIALRAEAFGPRQRALHASAHCARAGPSVRVISWTTLP